jgi:hypothetical protein
MDPASGGPEGQDGSAKPPVTTRRYERINRPTGGTRASRDNAMSQILAGGNVNRQSREALGRI